MAFVIDWVLLAVPGYIIGYLFTDTLIALGGWGRLIGFGLALAYFAVMDSHAGNGRTAGKRLVGIQVVTAEGAFLTMPKAALRFAILDIPYLLNGAPIPTDAAAGPFALQAIGVSLALFGLGLSLIYLFVFNRRTRQSVHDLVAGAYVLNHPHAAFVPEPIWQGHYAIVALLFLVSAVLPALAWHFVPRPSFEALQSLQTSLQAQPGVQRASVSSGTTSSTVVFNGKTTSGTRSYVFANVRLDHKRADLDAVANSVAVALLASPNASADIIRIDVGYGYDIGIASMGWNQSTSLSADAWRKKIGAKADPV